jgi:hypothetical protein
MTYVKLETLVKLMSRKSGVEIPDSVMEKIKEENIEIEEETEGEYETKINSFMTPEEAIRDKGVRKVVKSELWGGFEDKTLLPFVKELDEKAKATYDSKKGADEQTAFLINYQKTKGANAEDYKVLQEENESYRGKFDRNEVVEIAKYNELNEKVLRMQKDSFMSEVSNKVKNIPNISKSVIEDEDFDFNIMNKMEKHAKKKGWTIDWENRNFLDANEQVVKVKGANAYGVDDFVKDFEMNNQHYINKSPEAKGSEIIIEVPEVKDRFQKTALSKLNEHKMATANE